MEKLFNRVFNILSLSSLIFLIVGLILTFLPAISLSVVSYSLAVILIVVGIAFMVEDSNNIFWSSFSIGLIALVLGIIILIAPTFLTNIITIVLGVIFILSGISKINITKTLKEKDNSNWITEFIIACLSIICGIILLIKPTGSAITITTLIGIVLIIYSISDLINTILVKKEIKSVFKIFKK